jgi:hypothetical protein
MKAVIFARLPVAEDQEDRHISKLRKYARKNGLEIIKEFKIVDGSDANRKEGFNEIVHFVNNHEELIAMITHPSSPTWNQACGSAFLKTYKGFLHFVDYSGKILDVLNRDDIKPNQQESLFLEMSYGRFMDIFDYVMRDEFWSDAAVQRFHLIKDAFSIYNECLNYDPIKVTIERIKISRPPMEGEIAGELFKVIRNVLMHFPFFTQWDDVNITKNLINWHKPSQTIDRFFEKYQGKDTIKYRYWESDKKRMTYLSINFPSNYEGDIKFYLKNLLAEKEGIPFCLILMKQVLNSGAVYE